MLSVFQVWCRILGIIGGSSGGTLKTLLSSLAGPVRSKAVADGLSYGLGPES